MKKAPKIILRCLGILLGLVLAVLVALQILLTPRLTTKLVNRYATEFIDGTLSFGKVDASLFKHWPNVTLELEDAALTYPHERFDSLEPGTRMMNLGRGELADTLASFKHFGVALNLPSLLVGTIHIPLVELERPRVFAKQYNDSTANWNMFPIGESEKDTTSTGIPSIKLNRISLNGGASICYSSIQDTISAAIRLKRLGFRGMVSTKDPHLSKGGLMIDTLGVSARLPQDTLAFRLSELRLSGNREDVALDARAGAALRTRSFGRMRIPMELSAHLAFPEDSVLSVSMPELKLNVGGVPFQADGDIRVHSDRYWMDLRAGIYDCDIATLLAEYVVNFWDGAKELKTDAVLDLRAEACGYMIPAENVLPDLSACLKLPHCTFDYKPVGQPLEADIDIDLSTDEQGRINLEIDEFDVDAEGICLNVKGGLADLLGEDPLANVDALLKAQLENVMKYVPDSLGVKAAGFMQATLKGKARASQLSAARIADADINAEINSGTVTVDMPADTISAVISGFRATAKTMANERSKTMQKGERMMSVLVYADRVNASIPGAYADAEALRVSAYSAASLLDSDSRYSVHPMRGTVFARSVTLRDVDSCVVGLRNTMQTVSLNPYDKDRSIPQIELVSSNGGAYLRGDDIRVSGRNIEVKLSAANVPSSYAKGKGRRQGGSRSGSLQRRRPAQDGPRTWGESRPEWLRDTSLRSGDLRFSMSDEIRKFMREWTVGGVLGVAEMSLITPYFPLRTSMTGLSAKFDNDSAQLQKFGVVAGDSDLNMTATIKGLYRMLEGRGGVLNVDAGISSETLNANQLLTAYSLGSQYVPTGHFAASAETPDEELMIQIEEQSQSFDAENQALLIVPANLVANVTLDAHNVKYSSLVVDTLSMNAVAKERCLQIADFQALSNAGDIFLDAFYATKTRQNVSAGFSLRMKDITAQRVIDLIPAVDDAMPMLKHFTGLLDCRLSATSSLDEHMNFIVPSMEGVMRITGNELMIRGSKDFSRIAKLLLFKDSSEAVIDSLSVEGLLHDSKVEIFPFVVTVDRYQLALAGVQNMAQSSYNYNISLLHSPQPLKFGVDLVGNDGKTRFKVGKPKYKDASSVPAYTEVIDQTDLNLVDAIRNIFSRGIDSALNDGRRRKSLDELKRGAQESSSSQAEELSSEEKQQLESLSGETLE